MSDYGFEIYMKKKKITQYVPDEVKKARKNFFTKGNKGNYLYIYYNVDIIDEIVNKTNQLWFKSPKCFSDKEEKEGWGAKFFYVLLYLKRKKYSNKFKDIVEKAFKTYDINEYHKKYFVLCTSYEADNNLCWNSFLGKNFHNVNKVTLKGIVNNIDEKDKEINIEGDFSCEIDNGNTKGACICLNKSSLDCTLKKINTMEGFINYDFDRMNKMFFDCLKIIYLEFKELKNEKLAISSIQDLIDRCNLFNKRKFYSGEMEYRYVISANNIDHILKNTPGAEFELEKRIIKFPFSINAIDHITITNSEDKERFNNFELSYSKIVFDMENIDFLKDRILYED